MNDLDAAIGAVEMGAEVVRRQVGAVLERVDKGGGDFATSADLEAEAAMLEFLRRHRPNDRLVGEESGGSGTGDASRVWLIDPLCGTLNYAVGMRVVAVNAALSTPDGVVAAAVADVFAGDVFWADVDHACVRASGVDAPIVPSASSMLVDLNFDPPFPSAPAFRAVTLAANEEFCATFRPRGRVQLTGTDVGCIGAASRLRDRRGCAQQRAFLGRARNLQGSRLQHLRPSRRNR